MDRRRMLSWQCAYCEKGGWDADASGVTKADKEMLVSLQTLLL